MTFAWGSVILVNIYKYLMNDLNLKAQLLTHIGATRTETVDYIWTVLASRNIQMSIDNKEEVLTLGKTLFNSLLVRW